jgi:hypothetical protein
MVSKKGRNSLLTIKGRNSNWIGHILGINCLLKHVIEGNGGEGIEMSGRRGRRRKQLLNNLAEREGTGNRNTMSLSVENWLWMRLWAAYRINGLIQM